MKFPCHIFIIATVLAIQFSNVCSQRNYNPWESSNLNDHSRFVRKATTEAISSTETTTTAKTKTIKTTRQTTTKPSTPKTISTAKPVHKSTTKSKTTSKPTTTTKTTTISPKPKINLSNETASDENDQGTESEEVESRGLIGKKNVLETLLKTQFRCYTVGSYGVRGDCSKYMYCKKIGLIPSMWYCPTGKSYDHFERLCMESRLVNCRNICKQEGLLLSDPKHSNGFFKCIKKIPMPYSCSNPDDEFDFGEQKCVNEDDSNESEDGDDTDDW